MAGMIEEKDLKTVEEIAKRYNLSVFDLSKIIISQTRKNNRKQFRVSDAEFTAIFLKAHKCGMTVTKYCEYACGKFLDTEEVDDSFFGCGRYGEGRTKRITVSFKDELVETKLENVARKLKIEIGSLIRYCALNY